MQSTAHPALWILSFPSFLHILSSVWAAPVLCPLTPPSLAAFRGRKQAPDLSGSQGGSAALTQHTDEGVGQQVAVLIGGVTLVHGPAADLRVPEDDGVPGHLTVRVGGSRCRRKDAPREQWGRAG